MQTLTEIMDTRGSDKGAKHWPAHNYTWLYDHWMSNRRMDSIRLMEIGVTFRVPCASILGWADYFPNGHIVGYDLDDWEEVADHPRISLFKGDQGSPDDLKRFMRQYRRQTFDYIIDDGSHKTRDQVTTFVKLFHKLRWGGLYIIEDCSRETVAAFDSLRLHGIMLPPLDCPVTLEESVLVSETCGACLHSYIPGCARRARKMNHLLCIHRTQPHQVPSIPPA
jgi:hypothetical protein